MLGVGVAGVGVTGVGAGVVRVVVAGELVVAVVLRSLGMKKKTPRTIAKAAKPTGSNQLRPVRVSPTRGRLIFGSFEYVIAFFLLGDVGIQLPYW